MPPLVSAAPVPVFHRSRAAEVESIREKSTPGRLTVWLSPGPRTPMLRVAVGVPQHPLMVSLWCSARRY